MRIAQRTPGMGVGVENRGKRGVNATLGDLKICRKCTKSTKFWVKKAQISQICQNEPNIRMAGNETGSTDRSEDELKVGQVENWENLRKSPRKAGNWVENREIWPKIEEI
jgi:hypothetical protein